MQPFNLTKLKMAWMPGMLQPPNHSLTLMVKGCFDLVPDNKAVFSEDTDASTIMGDTFIDDNPSASLTYASDLVIFKPKADLTLTGVAYPECGKGGCRVTFAVGNWQKSLAIFNDRFWHWGKASTPEPFAADNSIPLTYENAFGGERYSSNPVGKGDNQITSANGESLQPLPNIEHNNVYLSSPAQKSPPAGYGPLKSGWGDKIPLIGTYDNKWLKENFPYFPHDFNWGYFNSAPRDQQVAYLAGDEALYFEHLRPELPQFKSRLPAIRPRLFVKGQYEGQPPFFHEITLRLDTLHIDMEKQQVNLVWRGIVGVQSDEYEELENACLFVEDMAEEHKSNDYYLKCLHDFEKNKDSEFDIEEFENEQGDELPIPIPEEATQTSEALHNIAASDIELDNIINKQFAKLKTQLQDIGISEDLIGMLGPDMEPNLFSQKIFETYNISPDDGNKLLEKSQQEFHKLMIEHGHDPAEFSPPDIKLDVDASPIEQQSEEEKLEQALAEHTNFDEAELIAADLSGRNLSGRSFRNADLTKANLTGANISGCDFSDADLSNCILDNVNAEGAIFDNAILDGIHAHQANFVGISALMAQFQLATLVKANFNKANLSSADFTNSIMSGVLFEEATLLETLFEQVDLSQSQFIQTSAKLSNFTGANLRECWFSHCGMREVNFTGSRLTLAIFEQTELSNALMENVDADSLKMNDCSLNGVRAGEQSNFNSAHFLEGSAIAIIFDGADLTNAIFDKVPLQSADFSNANLSKAQFLQCDLKMAEFTKAAAIETQLSGVNLFQANFTKAKLTKANLSLSNLYGAEFFQAKIENTNLKNANIKQTKIALGMVK